MNFVNKGNGPALNFRWRDNVNPERWRAYRSNIIAAQEKGVLKAGLDWQKGLVLSYNSSANPDEILTYVTVDPYSGSVTNTHDVNQGSTVTRLGWSERYANHRSGGVYGASVRVDCRSFH
jgi:hypothetical protein